ncbi:hypothetical protein GLYMA_06G134833v4 [Glycine max]|nr:hypothetical protein GLYMA_06G134833v4 [Glycine max]KAH1125722.1 hypothetical protein GYH30_015005 [Glycine max]
MSFAALLAILLLLMSFELGSAAQPSIKLGTLLLVMYSEDHIYMCVSIYFRLSLTVIS